MAICVCKCLNVLLESEKFEQNVDVGKLDLPSEQRDFFSEKLLMCPGSFLKSRVSQPGLTSQRLCGTWVLHCCLACEQTTHAVSQDLSNTVLIPKHSLTTIDKVNQLKRTSNFSPVFNLLLPEATGDVEMKENINSSNVLITDQKNWATSEAIGSLSKQMNQTLQLQLEAIEEAVRQYRDQKYAEFEAYRERAHREHKMLASIISKARAESWAAERGPPSPQLPPLQRRRLSSIKDAKKMTHSLVKPPPRTPQEEDSLDSEDIFDLEGMDSRQDLGSDQDDYDTDESESHDEGIHIARGGGGGRGDLARSLPVNMPRFSLEDGAPRRTHRFDDDEEPSHDIAASIKALAKSVHGDAFELPRPRFSTQI